MYHSVMIIGYLGQDPTTKFLESGSQVTNFSVATSRKWNNKDGSKGEETVWWRVAAWGRLGEVCAEYLAKGRLVMVKGQMKPDDKGNPRTFTRNDGSPGASYEVTANEVKFLGGKGNGPSHDESDPGMPSSPDEEDPIIPF